MWYFVWFPAQQISTVVFFLSSRFIFSHTLFNYLSIVMNVSEGVSMTSQANPLCIIHSSVHSNQLPKAFKQSNSIIQIYINGRCHINGTSINFSRFGFFNFLFSQLSNPTTLCRDIKHLKIFLSPKLTIEKKKKY